MDYETWTRNEIARLRAASETALAEAATLQRTLDKWLHSQGSPVTVHSSKTAEKHASNGGGTKRRKAQRGYGNKNAIALEKIKGALAGITTDELFPMMVEAFGPDYKRSSLRALLWNQKERGNIELRDGRYLIAGTREEEQRDPGQS